MKNDEKKNENYNMIQESLQNFIKNIELKYFDVNFNIINELLDTFGESDYEKVKFNINKLSDLNKELEKVLVNLVKTHNKDFFKILSFVRQVNNDSESITLKISDFKESISLVKTNNEIIKSNNANTWKLKSIFYVRIVQNLKRISSVLKCVVDCEELFLNNKVFSSIKCLNKTLQDYSSFDKDFRKFDLLVSCNERLAKIRKKMNTKLQSDFETFIVLYDHSNYSNNKSKNIRGNINNDNKAFLYSEKLLHIYSFLLEKATIDTANFSSFLSLFKLVHISENFHFKLIKYNNSNKIKTKNNNLDVIVNTHYDRLILFFNSFTLFPDSRQILENINNELLEKIMNCIDNIVETYISLILKEINSENISERQGFSLFFQVYYYFCNLIHNNYTSFKFYILERIGEEKYLFVKLFTELSKKIEIIFIFPLIIFMKINDYDLYPLINAFDHKVKDSKDLLNNFAINDSINLKLLLYEQFKPQIENLSKNNSLCKLYELLNRKTSIETRIKEVSFFKFEFYPIIIKLSYNFLQYYKNQNIEGIDEEFKNFEFLTEFNNRMFYLKKRINIINDFTLRKSTLIKTNSSYNYDENLIQLKDYITCLDSIQELLFYSNKRNCIEIMKILFIIIYYINDELSLFLNYFKSRTVYDKVTQELKTELNKCYSNQYYKNNNDNIKNNKENDMIINKNKIENFNKYGCLEKDNCSISPNICCKYTDRLSKILFSNASGDYFEKNLLYKSKSKLNFFLKFCQSVQTLIGYCKNVIDICLNKIFSDISIKLLRQQNISNYFFQFYTEKRKSISEILNKKDCEYFLEKFLDEEIKSKNIDYFDYLVGLILHEEKIMMESNCDIMFMSKMELSLVFYDYFIGFKKRNYVLTETQNKPDNYVINFIKEYSSVLSSLEDNLTNTNYLTSHLSCFFNKCSIKFLLILNDLKLNDNSQNIFLINYEYIMNKILNPLDVNIGIFYFKEYINMIFSKKEDIKKKINEIGKEFKIKDSDEYNFLVEVLDVRDCLLNDNIKKELVEFIFIDKVK